MNYVTGVTRNTAVVIVLHQVGNVLSVGGKGHFKVVNPWMKFKMLHALNRSIWVLST